MKQRVLDYLADHWFALSVWAIILGIATYYAVKHWTKIRQFLVDVREELKKCTWPTLQELRESTVVVAVSVIALGVFVAFADIVFSKFFGGILYAFGLHEHWF